MLTKRGQMSTGFEADHGRLKASLPLEGRPLIYPSEQQFPYLSKEHVSFCGYTQCREAWDIVGNNTFVTVEKVVNVEYRLNCRAS